MGILLSTFGVSAPGFSMRPSKLTVGTIFGTQITLAYVLNVVFSIIAILLIILLEYGVIPAVKQGFYCNDPLISHKYQGDTITPELLGITATLLPIVIIICSEILSRESIKNIDFYVIVFYITECTVGLIMTLLITSIAKVLVGEHRPHFLDTCQPNTAKNCTAGQFVETFTCTSTEFNNMFLVDSSLSFPSGHSSISWFVGIFSAYVVQTRVTTVNAGYIAKQFLISVCLTWSLLCSLSRITDRRHHWWDVLAGSIMGICFGVYFIYTIYEKLKEKNSHICTICLEKRISLVDKKVENNTVNISV